MAVFSIITANPHSELADLIGSTFANNFALSDRSWLITSDETAQTIARKLGVAERDQNGLTHSKFGHIFVSQLSSNYWGFGSTATWDWLKSAFEKNS